MAAVATAIAGRRLRRYGQRQSLRDLPAMTWFVYLLECRDGSLYTGITTDVERRFAEHAAGKGARYTRAHPPSRLLGAAPQPDRASALRAELAIKRLSPAAKRALSERWLSGDGGL